MEDNTNPPTTQSVEEFLAEVIAQEEAEAASQAPTQETQPEPTPEVATKQEETPTAVEGESKEGDPEPQSSTVEPQLPANLRAIAAREAAAFQMKQEAEQATAKAAAELQALKARMAQDPVATMREQFGLEYADITRHVVEGADARPQQEVTALQNQLAQLQAQQAQMLQQMEAQRVEAENARHLAQVAEIFAKEVDAEGNPNFPLLTAAHGAEAPARLQEYINAHYQKTQEVMPVAIAAKEYEDHYEKEFVQKYKGNKRLLALLTDGKSETPATQATKPTGTATQTLKSTAAGQTVDSDSIATTNDVDEFLEGFSDLQVTI